MLLTAASGYGQTDFEEALISHGIIKEECIDLSAEAKIKIATPRCAYVNITSPATLPTQKGTDAQGMMEFYDGNGHYFNLPIVIDVQGNSSTGFEKKNFAIDFYTDNQLTASPDIAFGNWVNQDGFHLKAYYLEKFRGAAMVGYQLFDEIVADHDNYQQRAGLENITKARCYPDGFPCIVYHRGQFYGIYSWQLKKHRKNMNLDKALSTNIHLDGEISDRTFWIGQIDWTKFEVRNPKTLYTRYGTLYDGENPSELIDRKSKKYSATNPDMVATAETKTYIQNLTKYCSELDNLIRQKASAEKMRQEIEKRFDVTGMIDYMLHAIFTNNFDGFRKNWQWFTYDGVKWFVAPYDLDGLFGNYWDGSCIMDADKVTIERDDNNYQEFDHFGMYNRKPFTYIETYYKEEMINRYVLLRSNGIFSKANVIAKYHEWAERVGDDNYALEWQRWPKCPCITKYSDSYERVENWLDQRIELADKFAGVTITPTAIVTDSHAITPATIDAVFSADGTLLPEMHKGVNIIRMSNGTVRKIAR